MNLYDVYCLYEPLSRLKKQLLPFTISKRIADLAEEVEKQHKFYLLEQRKILHYFLEQKKAFLENFNINFSVSVDTEQNKRNMLEFLEKSKELRDLEILMPFEPIHITDLEMGNQPISGEDIENLKPFILFGGD